MFGAKHKFAGCSLLVLSDINKLHASDWHCWVYIPGVCWWKDAFSERVRIIIYIKQLFSCYCWTPILRLLNAVSLQLLTLSAASVFYGAPCLEGRCCKSCVIYKKKEKTGSPVCQFHLHKPQRCTNRLWPEAIPPWNFFLYQTARLSTLPFTLVPPPSTAPALGRWCCFLCACLWLSSMGSTWQRMYVAGFCLDTSVSPSLLSPRPRSVRTAVSMAMKEVCSGLVI